MISKEILRRFPHFTVLPFEDLKKVAMLSRSKTFEPGERLFTEGNSATHLMFLITGEIHIIYQLGNGEEVVADTLVAGDPMAWSALLEPHILTSSGVASKAGSLIEIDAEGLRCLCEEDTEFGFVMIKEVAKTLRSRLSAMRVQAAASLAVPVG